jgi:hypothetical protein
MQPIRFPALASTVLLVCVLMYEAGPTGSAALNQEQKANQTETQPKKKNQGKKKAAAAAATAEGEQARPARASAGVKNSPPNAEYLRELTAAATEGGAHVLSSGDSYDDFVSVAETSNGTVFAAYAAYFDGHDQIRIHRRLADGWWTARTYVPLVQARSDIWMPQLAVDAKDRVWVIWSEQTGQSRGKTGNFDLYARPLLEDRWGDLVRLTDDPKPDINHHVATDAAGNIHVVWQSHARNNGDVSYIKFDGEKWSKPLAVTSDDESDWYPRVAVDAKGTAWIAFDSYRNGDYDVFLTSVSGGKPGKIVPIATSSFYEAHASVACTPDGRVWVAWEQGGANWGKDQGYWLGPQRENRNQGTTLGSGRSVQVACWHDGKVLAAPSVRDALPAQNLGPQANRGNSASAELATGRDGRLWLRVRQMIFGATNAQGRVQRGWSENVTHLTKDGWAPMQTLPASIGRISVFSRIVPARDGSLLVAYSADARVSDNYHRPIQDQALVKQIAKPDGEPGVPDLKPYTPPDVPVGIPAWNASQEAKQVAAIRAHRVTIDGKPHQIVRGDMHRHTEMSWDVGPGNDGSFLDFYRYMIDVASMDFGGLTDHQGGGHYPYWWWLTEKSCDMYYLAPRFVPLYGYERSVTFPNGHRNIFHAYRGVPVFPFQIRIGDGGVFPGISGNRVVENDTKLLYEYLRGTQGLCMSHTSGTSTMGTDWRDNDPLVEPVVEIYQGARNSYESENGPRVHPSNEAPDVAPGGFQPAGYIWNAYAKGYRLGTTSSSDHGSTHISFSMIYVTENDRQPILDGMRKRHTYGATDNVIVEFGANGRFQGDEFAANGLPSLTLKATGTAKIAKLDLVRNNKYIDSREPKQQTIDLNYTDMQPEPGTNLYYYRLVQEDGQVAWSSPVWVNVKK